MSTLETPETLLLDVNEVAVMLTCSARHVWRMADGGHFPRPISIGVKLKRWPRSAVTQWVAEQAKPATARR